MKTILYATDRTEQAVPALRFAHDMSTNLGAELVIFYVYQMPLIRVPVTRLPDQMEYQVIEEQKNVLKAYCLKHLGNDMDGSRIRFEVKCNHSILNSILEKSEEDSPDLVLIGRKDKHTDRGIFAGNIGQGLVKRLSCPVLIAPNDVSNVPINTILYATDCEEADILAIKNLVPMAKAVNAKIHVVHIATEKQYAGKEHMEWFKEMLSQQVDYDKLEFKVIFSNHIIKKLNDHSQWIKADLLAVLHREEKGFYQNLFNKSLVIKLDSQIGIPLLSFNKAS
jgi:nucleotide-binding universal stress UspA family protein